MLISTVRSMQIHPGSKSVRPNLQPFPFRKFLILAQVMLEADSNLPISYFEETTNRFLKKKTSPKYDLIVLSNILQRDLEKPAFDSVRDITIITIVSLFIIGVFLYYILNLKLNELTNSSVILNKMAEGDLTVKFKKNKSIIKL